MLEAKQFTTILPVRDLERARGFYRDVIGLKELGETSDGGALCAGPGGGTIELIPRPDHTGQDRTLMSFEVPEIRSAVGDLEGRGVEFEDYDEPDIKTEDHIASFDSVKAAWFRDSEGNFLCLHQQTG